MDNETNVFPDFKPQAPMFETGDPQSKAEQPAGKKRVRKAKLAAPKPAAKKARKPRGARRTMPVANVTAEPGRPARNEPIAAISIQVLAQLRELSEAEYLQMLALVKLGRASCERIFGVLQAVLPK